MYLGHAGERRRSGCKDAHLIPNASQSPRLLVNSFNVDLCAVKIAFTFVIHRTISGFISQFCPSNSFHNLGLDCKLMGIRLMFLSAFRNAFD